MSILGVIAEYNPFHLGHAYHLQQAQTMIEPEATVVIMSGHFTQRGEVAIFDKWSRAQMALLNGADLVLELPTAFASRSAHYFALGALLSLDSLQIITHLAFGVEHNQPEDLLTLANLLAKEPPLYQVTLRSHLDRGHAFPRAQQLALSDLLPEIQPDLNQPNTILALNYLKIMAQHHLAFAPLFIQRQGNYHGPVGGNGYAGATAIRHLILSGQDALWPTHLPHNCTDIIKQLINQGKGPLTNNHFSQSIFTLLRRANVTDLAEIMEVSEGLAERFLEASKKTADLTTLCHLVKSKRHTYTRIQRILIHLLLNYQKQDQFIAPEYLRVLGFNAQGQKLLKTLKASSCLPIITKAAHYRSKLSSLGQKMFELDMLATDLYHLGFAPDFAQSGWDFYQDPIQV